MRDRFGVRTNRWLVGLAVLVLACSDSTGPDTPGLDLVFVTPNQGDRAFAATIVGEVDSVHAETGYTIFTHQSQGSLKLIVIPDADATFATGGVVVARLEIADMAGADDYRSFLTEVASADYELRSPGPYSVRLE
jgi:hypothetical protein